MSYTAFLDRRKTQRWLEFGLFHSRYFDLSQQEKHRCYINNGLLDSSVPVSHDSMTVSMHYTRTLKLKELNSFHHSFYDLHLCVIPSKCLQGKDSSSLTVKQSINLTVCSVFILFSITLTAILNMCQKTCFGLTHLHGSPVLLQLSLSCKLWREIPKDTGHAEH